MIAKGKRALWLRALKGRAGYKGIPFNLSVDDLDMPLVCPLLGILLVWKPSGTGNGPNPDSPSVDRLIPELGYVKGNVRIISHLANRMKDCATPAQLREFALNLPHYLDEAGL